MTPREARQALACLEQCIGDHRENYAALYRFIGEVEAIRNGRDVADQPAPTETAPPSAVAWAQGYLQSTNDGYSGRTSPNPYRPGWQGSDGESEGESDPTPRNYSKQVQRFHEEASERLYGLSRLALPGAKLTLLVRRPNAQDGSQDMVVTDDDIGEVIRALQIRLAANQPAPAPCSCGWALHQPRDGKCQRCGTPDPRLAHAPANPPGPRGGCCSDCGAKLHAGPCVHMRPGPLAREALASARLDVETHCLPDAEGPRGAREATAGWPTEEPGVLQRLRAEPQGAPTCGVRGGPDNGFCVLRPGHDDKHDDGCCLWPRGHTYTTCVHGQPCCEDCAREQRALDAARRAATALRGRSGGTFRERKAERIAARASQPNKGSV